MKYAVGRDLIHTPQPQADYSFPLFVIALFTLASLYRFLSPVGLTTVSAEDTTIPHIVVTELAYETIK